MVNVLRLARRWVSLVAGTVLGLFVPGWVTVHAATLTPHLWLSLINGTVVSRVVPLSAFADAPGITTIRFQVSGRDIGPPITDDPCVTSWDTRVLANGLHTVTAIGYDSVGTAFVAPPVVVKVANIVNAPGTLSPTGGAATSAMGDMSYQDRTRPAAPFSTPGGTGPGDAKAPPPAPVVIEMPSSEVTAGEDAPPAEAPEGGWDREATLTGTSVLRRYAPVDLRDATEARMAFESSFSSVDSRAEVQVSTDGFDWITVEQIASSEHWQPVEIDLGAFAGHRISVRLVFAGIAADAVTDVWRVRNVVFETARTELWSRFHVDAAR